MKPASRQVVIDLNISALTAILSRFLPLMIKRGRGRVLNVASVVAFQPAQRRATPRLFGAHGKLNRILRKCLCCFRGATLGQNGGLKY